MSTYKNQLFDVVMRENDSTDPRSGAHCVSFKRAKRASKANSVEWFDMVEAYAKSIGAETCHFCERRPRDSEFVCMVATYQSGNKEGNGRLNSTFHRYVIFRTATAIKAA